ncbi:hypothetical protein L7F22_015898, partial [Adiantum nelumboides]|nr:hypothetical protein [Adiantum nelumboides]
EVTANSGIVKMPDSVQKIAGTGVLGNVQIVTAYSDTRHGEVHSSSLADFAKIPSKLIFDANAHTNYNGSNSIRKSLMHQNESIHGAQCTKPPYRALQVVDANLSSSARTCISIENMQAGDEATNVSITAENSGQRGIESNESAVPADNCRSNQMHRVEDIAGQLAPLSKERNDGGLHEPKTKGAEVCENLALRLLEVIVGMMK